MDADEARAATAPGGPLEFVHAGGRIDVPGPSAQVWADKPGERCRDGFADQVLGAMVTACVNGRPTMLVDGDGREAVLISRARYAELVDGEAKRLLMGLAARAVAQLAERRLAELANAHGCEAAAEVARMEGRRDAAGEISGHRQGMEES